jgi:hypothetical protein
LDDLGMLGLVDPPRELCIADHVTVSAPYEEIWFAIDCARDAQEFRFRFECALIDDGDAIGHRLSRCVEPTALGEPGQVQDLSKRVQVLTLMAGAETKEELLERTRRSLLLAPVE